MADMASGKDWMAASKGEERVAAYASAAGRDGKTPQLLLPLEGAAAATATATAPSVAIGGRTA